MGGPARPPARALLRPRARAHEGPGHDRRSGSRRRGPRLRAGWRVHPVTTARRVLAIVLFVTSVVLFAVPGGGADPGGPALVTTRDLSPGTALSSGDVRVVDLPEAVRPAGVLTHPAQIEGRRLGAGARAGAPLTDARLVSGLRTPDGTTAVPVRLADEDVAGLLRPGVHVRLLAAGGPGTAGFPDAVPEAGRSPEILADRATVITVLGTEAAADLGGASPGGADPLVLVAVPENEAPEVAAASLGRPVTVLWD